ncbi:ATP-binding protein [Kitasatospora camelliae]|uniref:ATP-binding protein n=1 Tax=Kitasatospora camelliae TaxID=3156397 RepID=A0AAU8JV45_9ACTN
MELSSEAAGSAVGRHGPVIPGPGVWRISAVAHESSVPQTRHAVRDRLLAQGMTGERYQELIDDLLLIVSELVGNAVTHAAVLSPQVTTELAIDREAVRISVADGHPYRPKAQQSDLGQLSGRGLLLVKSITLQAGGTCDVERTEDGGKVIWASLPLPLPAPQPGEVPRARVERQEERRAAEPVRQPSVRPSALARSLREDETGAQEPGPARPGRMSDRTG